MFSINTTDPVSIEQIIMAQQDEPNQKNCIFRLQNKEVKLEKFYQIRVKSIEFLQKSGTAIYFYDISNHIKSLQLGGKIKVQKKKNKTLSLSQMTLSHEFRVPLSSILMILESLLESIFDEIMREKVCLVIAQINLLLCYITDMLDLKMLENGDLNSRSETFNPADAFKFVLSIFAQQAKVQ